MGGLNRNGCYQSFEYLRDRNDPWAEIEADQLGMRSERTRGGIIAVGDQHLGMMAGTTERGVDFGVNELMSEHEVDPSGRLRHGIPVRSADR